MFPSRPGRRVVIVQKSLPHYRRPLFDALRARLGDAGVQLVLICGDGTSADRSKKDLARLPWAVEVPNRLIPFFGRELCWQPVGRQLAGADLVVVEQANKLLLNYWLVLLQAAGAAKVAFWGHGRDFTAPPGTWAAERLKRVLSLRAAWWFAYTERSREVLLSWGYPGARITVLNNSIDTARIRALRGALTPERLEEARLKLGLKGRNVCVFSGGMYREKRLGFLLEAAALARRDVPDLELVLIGSGPESPLASEAASRHDWVRYTGPLFDEDQVVVYSLAKLSVMPGTVGLVILDGFALGVPLVTTDQPGHGPEIAYLEDGKNGLMTRNDVRSYAGGIAGLLNAPDRLAAMRDSALASGRRYCIAETVERFAAGILSALGPRPGA